MLEHSIYSVISPEVVRQSFGEAVIISKKLQKV